MNPALQSALMSLSVSLSSLPLNAPDAFQNRQAEAAVAYASVEVTGETKRDESLNVGPEEYAELYHVEDLPALAALEGQAEHFLVSHPESLADGESDRVEIRVSRRLQTMTVLLNGKEKWAGWKVSTGAGKFETKAGTFTPGELSQTYYSRGLGVILPYGIRFDGGNLIHAVGRGGETYLGVKKSHGEIRLHPSSAKLLFSLVQRVGLENTKILVQ